MRVIKLQPAPFIDNITDEGHVGTKLPYPFYVREDGGVEGQDFWRGDPLKAVGFQNDLAKHQVDLWWDDAVKDPQRAVGMYLVTTDSKGGMGVHRTAIIEVTEAGVEDPKTDSDRLAESEAEVHRLHRVVLALRGMLVAANLPTKALNDIVGPLNCSSCHAGPIEEDQSR